MKYREDDLAQCPYYQKDAKQVVLCEGINPDNRLHLRFTGNVGKRKHMQTYCENRWKECAITKMLNSKYDYCP